MTLADALELVIADTRENTDPSFTPAEAVESARTCDHDDVDGAVDEAELREAYHMVLDATDEELASV